MPSPNAANADWPQLDLVAHWATQLTLTWEAAFPEVLEAFPGTAAGDEDVSAMAYETSDTPHFCMQAAIVTPDLDGLFSVRYVVDDESLGGDIAPDLQRGPEFLARASALSQTGVVSCQATFEFPGDEFDAILPLPFDIRPPDTPNWPVGLITGLQGTGPLDAGTEQPYLFTLNVDPDSHITLILDMEIPLSISADAPTQALAIAREISEKLVLSAEA
ncbi:MAG: hypothetical protein QM692_11700 [Thermomicrobiales bacterium]